MAKALHGYLGGSDPRLTARLVQDNRRLRERVLDLESQLLRVSAENDQLVADRDRLANRPRMQPV